MRAIWRCRDTELNWVRMEIRLMPELMQLLIGTSMRRYFPAIGTAGLDRSRVRGWILVPRPPPMITPSTSLITDTGFSSFLASPSQMQDREGTRC